MRSGLVVGHPQARMNASARRSPATPRSARRRASRARSLVPVVHGVQVGEARTGRRAACSSPRPSWRTRGSSVRVGDPRLRRGSERVIHVAAVGGQPSASVARSGAWCTARHRATLTTGSEGRSQGRPPLAAGCGRGERWLSVLSTNVSAQSPPQQERLPSNNSARRSRSESTSYGATDGGHDVEHLEELVEHGRVRPRCVWSRGSVRQHVEAERWSGRRRRWDGWSAGDGRHPG